MSAENKVLDRVDLYSDQRNELLEVINRTQSHSEKDVARQELRAVNLRIANERNAQLLGTSVSPIFRPDLYCQKQTTEVMVEEIFDKLIEVKYENAQKTLFSWAAIVRNKGTVAAKGPFNITLGMDFTDAATGMHIFKERKCIVPVTESIEPGAEYVSEFMSAVTLRDAPYSFYVLIDADQTIPEWNEINNYYEYHFDYLIQPKIWVPDKKILNKQSKAGPALANYNDRIHMVHLGNATNELWHSRFDGNNWTADVKIPNQLSKSTPALAAFNGHLHMVHQGDSSNNLWHSWYNGSSWNQNKLIANQLSRATPALVAFEYELHMVHLGDSGNDLWHSRFDGYNWTQNVKIPNKKSKAAPAVAVIFGSLYLIHLGDSSNDIWYSRFDGISWSADVKIVGQTSRLAPALTAYAAKLHMMHAGNSSNDLWYSTLTGNNWAANSQVPNQTSRMTPALAGLRNRLYMVHSGNASNDLWLSWRTV